MQEFPYFIQALHIHRRGNVACGRNHGWISIRNHAAQSFIRGLGRKLLRVE
jgi:hypothetical protein